MAITLPSGFTITTKEAVDARLVLTKAQMLAAKDVRTPNTYFCVCSDDDKIYIYDINNTVDEATGRYRPIENYISFSTPEAKAQIEAAVAGSTTIVGLTTDVTALKTTVGDASSGLVKQVADNTTATTALQTKMNDVVVPHIEDSDKRLGDLEDVVYDMTLDELPGVVDGGTVTEDTNSDTDTDTTGE